MESTCRSYTRNNRHNVCNLNAWHHLPDWLRALLTLHSLIAVIGDLGQYTSHKCLPTQSDILNEARPSCWRDFFIFPGRGKIAAIKDPDSCDRINEEPLRHAADANRVSREPTWSPTIAPRRLFPGDPLPRGGVPSGNEGLIRALASFPGFNYRYVSSPDIKKRVRVRVCVCSSAAR